MSLFARNLQWLLIALRAIRSQHFHNGHTALHSPCNSELGSSSSHWLTMLQADGPLQEWLLCLECLFYALFLSY